LRTTAAILVAAGLAAAASANVTTRDTLSVGFAPGNGNDNVNFAISRVDDGTGNIVELGLKAKERFFGDANVGGTGNLYIVQAGESPVSGTNPTPDTGRAWWNLDTSFSYGTRSVADTLITVTITDIDGDVFSSPVDPFPPFINATDNLLQASQNFGFSNIAPFLGGFDPFALGDYTISASAEDRLSGADLGSVDIIVRVVPAPGATAVLGLAGLAAARRRRG
jgi:hypothetical protein